MGDILCIALLIIVSVGESQRFRRIRKIEYDIDHIKRMVDGTYETTRSIEDKLVRYITNK